MKNKLVILLCVTLSLLLLIFSVVSVNASTIVTSPEHPDFKFSVESDLNNSRVYGVHQYVGEETSVKIPEKVNSVLVKYIDREAFYKNSTVKAITLNSKMTQIRDWGIRNCENLEKIYCPPTLAVVWKYAMAYNKKIDSILLRNTSVENFYEGAFYNDISLKYISLPSTTKTIGGDCFSNTSLKTVVIPDGVTTISYYAFSNINSLQSVYIPSSVNEIGNSVFDGSTNVTVFCEEGSVAQQYCVENSVNYKIIDKNDFPSQKLGDTNNSGDVDINDVTTMQRELCNMDVEFRPENCDVNGDCTFDIKDVSFLQSYLVGLSELPY